MKIIRSTVPKAYSHQKWSDFTDSMIGTDPLSQMIETACEAAIKRAMRIGDISPRRLLTAQEAAVYLALSEREVYNMIANKDLIGIRHGRRVMIDLRDIENWIESNKV